MRSFYQCDYAKTGHKWKTVYVCDSEGCWSHDSEMGETMRLPYGWLQLGKEHLCTDCIVEKGRAFPRMEVVES